MASLPAAELTAPQPRAGPISACWLARMSHRAKRATASYPSLLLRQQPLPAERRDCRSPSRPRPIAVDPKRNPYRIRAYMRLPVHAQGSEREALDGRGVDGIVPRHGQNGELPARRGSPRTETTSPRGMRSVRRMATSSRTCDVGCAN
jgi:hypothetical protein